MGTRYYVKQGNASISMSPGMYLFHLAAMGVAKLIVFTALLTWNIFRWTGIGIYRGGRKIWCLLRR